ncbi:MAG: sugar ABC transporter permease [Abditibacteriales bacterium]|nr:sugar ABC transporter permease [Abditibacteriales bacterium]
MRQSLLKSIYQERWAYLFLLVPLTLFALFRVAPIGLTLLLGFMDWFPNGQPVWVGLENFAYLFADDIFWKSLWNTVRYTVVVVPVGLCISLSLAWLIHGIRSRHWQGFFKAAFYLPGVTSGAILALVWVWIYNPTRGLLNYALSLVGLPPQQWINDPDWALPSLMLMPLVGGHGGAIVLLTAAMGSIPITYYEAAQLDGANAWQQLRRITLPLLKPTLLFLLITGTIASFQVFTQVLMMTGGGPYYATTTLVYLIYTDAFNYFDFGKAAACATVLFVILAAVAVVQYRLLSSEVEY